MPVYEALASWWVRAAVMASFVIFTLEGVNFILFYYDRVGHSSSCIATQLQAETGLMML